MDELTPIYQMKDLLLGGSTTCRRESLEPFTRHRSTVEPMMTANNRKAVLDDRPPLINISEKELPRKERTTLAQLRSGHCRLLGSYKSRMSKDASLDVCDKTPHDKHIFNCPAHQTTITPSDLWNRPVNAIRELSYLEAGVLD